MRLVAELGSNHNGSIDRALALIDAAARAGFTDVKTQAWRVRTLFAPEALEARPELLERERLEVPFSWHETLRMVARAKGMRYGVTISRPEELALLPNADWLKVSSYSLLDWNLLLELKKVGLPLVVSTGMATYPEVWDAVAMLGYIPDSGALRGLTLMHCVSAYPAPPDQANLRSIRYLHEQLQWPVGWSDHTLSLVVLARAERVHGAEALELHWDLGDRKGQETKHSWTPALVALLRSGSERYADPGYYACDGKAGVKAPSVSETDERLWRADPSDGLRPLLELRARLRTERTAHAGTQQRPLQGSGGPRGDAHEAEGSAETDARATRGAAPDGA